MIERRDLLIGGACFAAVGLGAALRPSRRLSLLGVAKLGPLIPRRVGRWQAGNTAELIVPQIPGSLADRLYSETVAQIYEPIDGAGPAIMLLMAYGATQSDLLQLHRPESCYPALGFALEERHFTNLSLPADDPIPAVALTATTSTRTEDIVYWTRLGEYLPRTAAEQRLARFRTALNGVVADGVLVRASLLRNRDGPAQFKVLAGFLTDLVKAMPAADRKVLVGTSRAKRMYQG
ncbi:exosortase-associated protein EpsI, V-type [Novosphingobium sp.]|uniref:exosortase-associated protein EpsI, V-type n=1 Tax=Novosphingobium sp. TaxID=1874826 RepID=UPI00262D9670|nr:exosortase-associated protein EpsI, V-type [Novosphingobium sp.]